MNFFWIITKQVYTRSTNVGDDVDSQQINQNDISVQKIRRRNYDPIGTTNNDNVNVGNRIIFAKRVDGNDNAVDGGDTLVESRFELGHVAFWNRSLSTQEIVNMYKTNIVRTRTKLECCAKKRNGLAGIV